MENALEYARAMRWFINISKVMNEKGMQFYTAETRIKAEAENGVYTEIGGLVNKLIEILERTQLKKPTK